MLAVGLPVVTNSGVGDVAAVVEELEAGAILSSFDATAYREAIDHLSHLKVNPQQLREDSRKLFDVRQGIANYDCIYRRMTSRNTSTSRGAWEASE